MKNIVEIFKDCVDEYYHYYKKNVDNLLEKDSMSEDTLAECPFVCWNESDLRTYIIHNFLNKTKGGYTVHSEFKI